MAMSLYGALCVIGLRRGGRVSTIVEYRERIQRALNCQASQNLSTSPLLQINRLITLPTGQNQGTYRAGETAVKIRCYHRLSTPRVAGT